MKDPCNVGWFLALLWLAVLLCNIQLLWAGEFQSPQISQIASDILSTVDQNNWQARHGPSELHMPRRWLVDGAPVERVPHGQMTERLTMNRVLHGHSEERGSDDWQVNWVPRDELERPVFTRTPDSMVAPVGLVPQPQQTVAQSPSVVQLTQAPAQDQPAVTLVPQVPPVAPVVVAAQTSQVAPVARDQAVVAELVPVSDTLVSVDLNRWTRQRDHGHSGLEAPHRLADSAPVVPGPYGGPVERFPHGQQVDRYGRNRVPHLHSERVSDDWRVNWVPQGQLAAQDFPTRTADAMISPVVSVSQAQEQTVVQSPPVASVAQAQPVLQSPLESPMVTYTRPLVRSVAADCRENSVLVVVKRDLLGIGQLIRPSDVTLGGCAPTGQDKAAGVLLFQVPLQSCGSTLTMRADALVYTFTLLYMPHALGSSPIVRTNGAAVSVECSYLRLHNVSSSAIRPTWVPFLAARRSENRLVFSLKLMSDDWQSPRASNIYFLGDLINIEASVSVAHHVPLRVFVDGCVATLVPNVKAVPRYAFIENHGCLVDAKLTGSRSQFLRRRQPDKLQFQLDAFRFSGDPRSSIYLTCLLKATPAAAETNFEYKACSFVANRWVAAGGHERVCGCCDASCSERRERNQADEFKGEALLGPVIVHEFVKGGRK